AQATMTHLEAGALDAVDGPSFVDAIRLRDDPAYQLLVNSKSGAFYCICPNTRRSPTNNKLVRQALNYALDRQRMAHTVLQGLGQPEVLPWAPTSPAYDPTRDGAYAFDLDKARGLLQQAGLSSATLDLSAQIATPAYVGIAQIYQGDLAKIGISGTI